MQKKWYDGLHINTSILWNLANLINEGRTILQSSRHVRLEFQRRAFSEVAHKIAKYSLQTKSFSVWKLDVLIFPSALTKLLRIDVSNVC